MEQKRGVSLMRNKFLSIGLLLCSLIIGSNLSGRAALTLTVNTSPTIVGAVEDTITYAYHVVNTGDETVDDIIINDSFGNRSDVGTLKAHHSFEQIDITRDVTPDDYSMNEIVNHVHAVGFDSQVPPQAVLSNEVESTVAVAKIALDLDVDPSVVVHAGDIIQYTYSVSNVGGANFSATTLTDTKVGVAENLGSLSAGDSTSYIATYTVTQSDINTGSINNTATAVGRSSGVEVSDEASYSVHVAVLYVGPGQTYATIQAAVSAAAQNGDTIYLTAGQEFTGTGNYNINITKNLTFDRTGEGNDPIININGSYPSNLFSIDSGYTITMRNLDIRNGDAFRGGALYFATPTSSGLIYNCVFKNNSSSQEGGAIFFAGQGLVISGCTFLDNSAYFRGGAIYTNPSSGSISINCCRFAGNKAINGETIGLGDAIYNESGSTIAENNWWGTNTPNTVSNLFSGSVDYTPWITMSLSADPSIITPGGTSTIDLTFSNTCIPVTPVAFSTTDGTLTPTLANTVDGQASSTFNAAYSDLLRVVGTAGPDDENYSLMLTLTPSPVVRDLLLTKVALPITVDHAGQLISYTYTVSNAGNVYLNDVSLTDNKVIPTFNPSNPLQPGAVAIGTATYAVLQSDMDAGSITNEAIVTGTSEAGVSVTNNATQTVNATQNPGISITKKINDSVASIQEPGVVVASDSMMDISYIITNTGNVTLNVEVTDDHAEYTITPSTTTLVPDANITCMAQWYAPGINQLHKNIGTATGTTALSTVVTASASAYATSIPVNPYRYNFGCICTDEGEEHILIGSHNMPELDGNSLDFWMFNETPTVSFIGSLDLGQQIIMDSATYNTELGMNIAVLTQTQEGDTAIVLVTYDGVSTTSHSITPLSSQAFKAQWFVAPDSTPYIVTDEQNGMSLYEVNLATYELTLRSSVPNLGAGAPSAFLRWYPQGNSLYVIQGYNQNSIATYKVDLSVPEIQAGVTTDMQEQFMLVNSCATCYENLVLGGAGSGEEALLARCTVEDGELAITQTASVPNAFEVYYCERCCCGGDSLLVGTNNGLYSFNPNTLSLVASNTSMPNNVWINTCWCCDMDGDYCIAVDSDHETYVFRQDGSLNPILQLSA